jgi:hypothetical protein
MKNELDNTSTALVTTLPESVRIPLHSLQADLEYLIGRVIADGSCGPIIVKSMKDRLKQIEEVLTWRPIKSDLVERLQALVRHGRDQGMKMNDVEDAWREIERLRESNRTFADHAILGVAQQTWMPIETAPKDGTVVEIVDADSGLPEVFYGHWAQNDGWGDDPVWLLGTPEMWAAGRSSWRATLGHKKNAAACLGVLTSPTHWRPRSQFTSTPSEPAQPPIMPDRALQLIRQLAWYYDVNDCRSRPNGDALEVPIVDLCEAKRIALALKLATGPGYEHSCD